MGIANKVVYISTSHIERREGPLRIAHPPGESMPAIRSLTFMRIDFATEQTVAVVGEDQGGILEFASDCSTPSRQPESPCSLSNGRSFFFQS